MQGKVGSSDILVRGVTQSSRRPLAHRISELSSKRRCKIHFGHSPSLWFAEDSPLFRWRRSWARWKRSLRPKATLDSSPPVTAQDWMRRHLVLHMLDSARQDDACLFHPGDSGGRGKSVVSGYGPGMRCYPIFVGQGPPPHRICNRPSVMPATLRAPSAPLPNVREHELV